MLVKDITADDEDIFLELCKEFYNSNATLREYNEEITRNTFKHLMDHHENLWGYLMYDKETQYPLGYSLITSYWCNEEGGNVLVLDELYIRPEERHKGNARKFMDWLQCEYRGKATSITLEVLTSNTTAQNLYSYEGFAPDGFVTYTKKIEEI